MPATTTASRMRTSAITPPTMRRRAGSISFCPPCRWMRSVEVAAARVQAECARRRPGVTTFRERWHLLATPGHAGEAIMAEPVEPASDRTAGAGAAATLYDGDDEFGMHGGSFDGGEIRQVAGSRCCASQDAPQREDAVRTGQDSSRTCQDVCAAMKPSFHAQRPGNASDSPKCFFVRALKTQATLLKPCPLRRFAAGRESATTRQNDWQYPEFGSKKNSCAGTEHRGPDLRKVPL